jgi:hypothetical protein
MAPFTGEAHEVGLVVEGATTPWRWSELRGLGTEDGCEYSQQALPKTTEWRAWLTSERRPEQASRKGEP